MTTDLPIAEESHSGVIDDNSRMITLSVSSWVAHPDADFHDLGVDLYADRLGANAMRGAHPPPSLALGYKVTFEPAA